MKFNTIPMEETVYSYGRWISTYIQSNDGSVEASNSGT